MTRLNPGLSEQGSQLIPYRLDAVAADEVQLRVLLPASESTAPILVRLVTVVYEEGAVDQAEPDTLILRVGEGCANGFPDLLPR